MTASTPSSRRLARTALATGVALTSAVTLLGTAAQARPPAHNEQVVLHNETDKQPDAKSSLNGTAQVTSHDGSFVVFSTTAALVPWDTNEAEDVYLRSIGDGFTILVSAARGKPGNSDSFEPTISADGNRVAWTTTATNLVKDTNGDTLDVVVKNMQTDKIRLVSVNSKEEQSTKNSFFPVISGNGRHVSFQTFARLGAKDKDAKEDVYVRDTSRGRTSQVSLLPRSNRDVPQNVLNGDISDNGNLVTFGNDHDLWVRNVSARTTTRFHHEPNMPPCQPYDAGSAGRPAISGNGKYVAFASCATHLPGEDHTSTDVYRMTLSTQRIVRVTAGADHSFLPSLSRSGRYVGLGSDADDLVEGDHGDPDAFVADLRTGTIVRASQTADGTGGNSWSAANDVAISGDGHSLAYVTYADNLVENDAFDWPEALLWRD